MHPTGEGEPGDAARHKGFSESLLTGFGCVTTTQEALVADQVQFDRQRPAQPNRFRTAASTASQIVGQRRIQTIINRLRQAVSSKTAF